MNVFFRFSADAFQKELAQTMRNAMRGHHHHRHAARKYHYCFVFLFLVLCISIQVTAVEGSEPTLPKKERKGTSKDNSSGSSSFWSKYNLPFLFQSSAGKKGSSFNKEYQLIQEKEDYDTTSTKTESDTNQDKSTQSASSTTTSANNMSELSDLPWWVSMAGQLAPWAAFIVFLAPVPTIRQVVRDQNIGSLPLLPYSSMTANGFVWLVYGLLKGESKIYITNFTGFCLGCWYYYQYTHCNCPPKTASTHFKGVVGIILGVGGLAFMLPPQMAISVIGKLGVAICIALFASPLSALKTVMETKSAKSIPLPFTIACVTNCALWSILGLLDMHDVNIYLPNLLGLSCGIAQVVLKIMYGSNDSFSSKDKDQLPM